MNESNYASIIIFNLQSVKSHRKTPLINKFDIECGGTAGFIGTRIGFSPGQLVDFLLGWTGIDIAQDDTKNKEKKSE